MHEIGIFGSCMRKEFPVKLSIKFFSLESNCKHNCRTKMDAASSDRPFSPPTKFSMSRLTCRDYFKLRIQVLQLVTAVVSLLGGGLEWCIGQKSEKIHLHCFQWRYASLESNCTHNCRTKMDAASSDRRLSPPTNFSMSRLTYRDNFLQIFLLKTNTKYIHYYL